MDAESHACVIVTRTFWYALLEPFATLITGANGFRILGRDFPSA